MKKTLRLSLAAATLLAGNVFAMDLAGGKLTGDVRALYLSESGNYDENALGLGINPAFAIEATQGLTFEIGVGIAVPASESVEDFASMAGMAKSPDTAGDGSEMYSTLTKANVSYDFGAGFVKVGNQELNTPLAGSDDIRLVPNSFQAAVVGFTGIKNLTLVASQVIGMAGKVDSQADDPEEMNTMSDVALAGMAGGNDAIDDKPVTAIAAIYGNADAGANAQLWYYTMAEPADGVGAVNATYVDAGMQFGIVNVAAQYVNFKCDLWSDTATGLKAEITAADSVTVIAAMNNLSSTDDGISSVGVAPAYYAWGGYPEYAVADELWANAANWDGGSASKVAVAFSGIKDLSLTAGYVTFSDVGAGIDLIADYQVDEQVAAGLVYETVTLEDDYKTANSMEDYSITKIRASYSF